MTPDQASLAVLHGDAMVEEPSGIDNCRQEQDLDLYLGRSKPTRHRQERDARAVRLLGPGCCAVPQELCQRELVWELALLLRHQRHELLRKLLLRMRRLHVAAVLCQCELGSIRERSMGLLSQRRLFLGFSLSLGLDTLPLRQLGLLSGHRLGLAAGRHVDGAGKQFVRLISPGSGHRIPAPSPANPCSDSCHAESSLYR
jgi:hypothetical protein